MIVRKLPTVSREERTKLNEGVEYFKNPNEIIDNNEYQGKTLSQIKASEILFFFAIVIGLVIIILLSIYEKINHLVQ